VCRLMCFPIASKHLEGHFNTYGSRTLSQYYTFTNFGGCLLFSIKQVKFDLQIEYGWFSAIDKMQSCRNQSPKI